MQLRHCPDAKIIIPSAGERSAGRAAAKNQDSTASGTSGSGYGLPLWASEGHSLADHRSVAPCGNYGKHIRVVSTTAMRRNSFLFCVSSVNPASFHPIDSGTACPVLTTGRPVSLGFVRLGDDRWWRSFRKWRQAGSGRRACDCHGLR